MTINCERQQRSSGSSPYFTTGCPLSPQNAVSSCGFLSLAHPPCFSLPQSRSWLAFDSVHHLPSTCASTRWLLSPWKQLSHKSPTSFSFSLLLKPALTWCRISSLASYVLMFILLSFFFLIHLFILFIYFWPRWVFVAARGLSLAVVSGGSSSWRYVGFSLQCLLFLQSTGSRHAGSEVVALRLSSCGSWALERRLNSCGARA